MTIPSLLISKLYCEVIHQINNVLTYKILHYIFDSNDIPLSEQSDESDTIFTESWSTILCEMEDNSFCLVNI